MTWTLILKGIDCDEQAILRVREQLLASLDGFTLEGTVTVDTALFDAATRPAERVNGRGAPGLEHVQATKRTMTGARRRW